MMNTFQTQLFMASITNIVATPTAYTVTVKPQAPRSLLSLYRCTARLHIFHLDYAYEARKPSIKEEIIDIAFHGSQLASSTTVLGSLNFLLQGK
jgi:hypothetical protein